MTAEQARKLFSYDTDTGIITRLRNGKTVSGLNGKGYVQVTAGRGVTMLGHRLAWLLHYGEWPDDQIDHENRVRSDNKILNLRKADNGLNGRNKGQVPSRKKDQDLPVGISRRVCRGKLYFVVSCGWHGKPRQRLCTTLGAAINKRKELETLSQPKT